MSAVCGLDMGAQQVPNKEGPTLHSAHNERDSENHLGVIISIL